MKNHDPLEGIRGMGEPYSFAFNVIDHGLKMVVHAVVFTSFEMPVGSYATVQIGDDGKDPRYTAFVKFIWDNYLKEKKHALDIVIKEVDTEKGEWPTLKQKIEAADRLLKELSNRIDEIKEFPPKQNH